MKKISLAIITVVVGIVVAFVAYRAGREIWPLNTRVAATAQQSSRCPNSDEGLLVTLTNNSRATIQYVSGAVDVMRRNHSSVERGVEFKTDQIFAPGETIEICAAPPVRLMPEVEALLATKPIPASELEFKVNIINAQTDDLII